MPRSLSLLARQSLTAQETDVVWVALIEIKLASLSRSLIFCSPSNTNITHTSTTWTAFPFELTLPDERDDKPPRVTITIDNIDRQVMAAVRPLKTAPTIDLSIVTSADNFAAKEIGPLVFTLQDINVTAQTLTATLEYESILSEAYPATRFDPVQFSAIF